MAVRKTLALTFLMSVICVTCSFEDADFWLKSGQERLRHALRQEHNLQHARNVIIFIGDGMGINTVTAGRIFQGQRHGGNGEEYRLSFEKFPSLGLAKTYCVDKQVPDSAATATSILTGVKVKYNTIGLDARITSQLCDPIIDPGSRLPGLATWAQQAGKSTGFVTTTRITHATPAAFYAHSNYRAWECDGEIPLSQRGCIKDIARQLVEDAPGNQFKVMLAGGLTQMGVYNFTDDADSCIRTDGKNLVNEWLKGKQNGIYVNSSDALMAVDLDKTEHLLGLFSPDHMPYVSERKPEHPSLVNMTRQAIRMLNKNKNGYVLLVEAGRIDMGHHENMAKLALQETAELDATVATALDMTDPKDTLIIVTADHSHAFTFNGYASRGNDILGFANKPEVETYETLTYANGPGYLIHRANSTLKPNATWNSLHEMDRSKGRYRHMAARYINAATHAGEDVAVFSTGPFAHLLNGVFEQNYIAHAVSFAACVGPSKALCKVEDVRQRLSSTAVRHDSKIVVLSVTMFLILKRFMYLF